MSMKLIPMEQEILEVLDRCNKLGEADISLVPGFTYEQGILAAICWLTMEGGLNPFKDIIMA
jgi:hypothetical protein